MSDDVGKRGSKSSTINVTSLRRDRSDSRKDSAFNNRAGVAGKSVFAGSTSRQASQTGVSSCVDERLLVVTTNASSASLGRRTRDTIRKTSRADS